VNRVGPYTELVRNFAADLVSVRTASRRFLPLMTNFYLTKQCNLRCRYCYPPGDEPSLPVDEMVALLDKIRPRNPAINLTGGEPLLYPGIVPVLRRIRELAFRPVLLSTNGLLLERIAGELGTVDRVIISLDSPHPDANDTMTGVPGSTPRIVQAIELAARLSRVHGFALSVHAVISPETIGGIEDLVRFCGKVGATFTASPEHGRVAPSAELISNPAYGALIDRLAALEREGAPIICSQAYLRAIRDFGPHRCFPWISPRVEPDGRVYLPCQRLRRRHVFLQDYPSLVELMRREAEFDASPECARSCYLACYLEPERFLRNPFALLESGPMRRALLGARREEPEEVAGVLT